MLLTLQERLRDLISKGKTQLALDSLTEQLRDTEEGNIITLLQSRYRSNQRANMTGIISNSDFMMENNRINYALLSVISDLEDNPSNTTIVKQVQEVIHKIEISGTGNFVNFGGNVTMGDVAGGNMEKNADKGDVHIGDNVGGDKIGRDKVSVINNLNNQSNLSENSKPNDVKKKIILFIAANPEGKSDVTSGKESQYIRDSITNGSLRENYGLEISFASNIESLLRLLKKFKPSIVHLSMHGSKSKGMLFEDVAGNVDFVSTDTLSSFFELINFREKVVECVVLSACNSDVHAEAVNQYVDYSIGMQGAVPSDVAMEYTKGFYSSLLEGDDYIDAHQTSKIFLKRYASKVDYPGEIAIPDIPKLFEPRLKS